MAAQGNAENNENISPLRLEPNRNPPTVQYRHEYEDVRDGTSKHVYAPSTPPDHTSSLSSETAGARLSTDMPCEIPLTYYDVIRQYPEQQAIRRMHAITIPQGPALVRSVEEVLRIEGVYSNESHHHTNENVLRDKTNVEQKRCSGKPPMPMMQTYHMGNSSNSHSQENEENVHPSSFGRNGHNHVD